MCASRAARTIRARYALRYTSKLPSGSEHEARSTPPFTQYQPIRDGSYDVTLSLGWYEANYKDIIVATTI